MDTSAKVVIGSIWAFEDIGVQKLTNLIKSQCPDLDCHLENSKTDGVLIINGVVDAYASRVATTVADFIEEQRNKDLLEMPSIRQLDGPAVGPDDFDLTTVSPERGQEKSLLALDDEPEDLISSAINPIDKTWKPSLERVDCFASDFHETLKQIAQQIAKSTGTVVVVMPDRKVVQVTGRRAEDVGDAMGKLTRVEASLSYFQKPHVAHLPVAPKGEHVRYRIQNYNELNYMALRRILTDSNVNTNVKLGEYAASVLLLADGESALFKLPENLSKPPQLADDIGPSRIWCDFTFQEIGKPEDYLSVDSIIDKEPGVIQAVASEGVSLSHPYLTAEKAKQVNKWVAERAGAESSEHDSDPAPSLDLQSATSPVTVAKMAPGIKARKVIPASQVASTPPQPALALPPKRVTNPPKPVNSLLEPDVTATPRRKWKETFEINPNMSSSNEVATNSARQDIDFLSGHFDSSWNRKNSGHHAFDPTKYSTSKTQRIPPLGDLSFGNGSQPQNGDLVDLIDIFPAADDTKSASQVSSLDPPAMVSQGLSTSVSLLSFHQPALIPQKSTSSNSQNHTDPGQQLLELKSMLNGQAQGAEDVEITPPSQPKFPAYSSFPSQQGWSNFLAKEKLVDLERAGKSEQESCNEVTSRHFYRTMSQKAAAPDAKTKAKLAKEKRQNTLEDAWGIVPKKISKNQAQKTVHSIDQNPQQRQKETQGDLVKDYLAADIKELFTALAPVLNAAEYFPGMLSLELQFGLVLIPVVPKTYRDNLMSEDQWKEKFNPRTGLPPPTTTFFNRLTSSGIDIDHIVNLHTPKKEGRRRLFEQEYTEYSVSYEFHCRTKTDKSLLIIVDEQGQYSIHTPKAGLGEVNLHFPRQVWDARVAVSGNLEYCTGSNQDFEKAAEYIVGHMWIQPDKSQLHLFTRLPQGNGIVIEKILMKRWTRHRHIRSDDVLKPTLTAANPSTGPTRSTAASSGDAKPCVTANPGNDASETSDIFLQVMEVQDLFVGVSPNDSSIIRARCSTHHDMVRKGRLWYEASLISPSINTLLGANASVEAGERTSDWCSIDLFGRHAATVTKEQPSEVASAIGAGGIGDMFCLAKAVVEKMDGVGFLNMGPGADPSVLGNNGSLNFPHISSKTTPPNVADQAIVKVEPKSWGFDEMRSVPPVTSVIAGNQLAKAASSTKESVVEDYYYW